MTDKKKITYGSGCSESMIDFCMNGKVDCKCVKNVEVISGELQHSLVMVDIDKKEDEINSVCQKA